MGLLERLRNFRRRGGDSEAPTPKELTGDVETDAEDATRPAAPIVDAVDRVDVGEIDTEDVTENAPGAGTSDTERPTPETARHAPGSGGPAMRAEARALADEQFTRAVPWGMQIASAWAWRLIVIAAAVALAGWLIVKLTVITIPLGVAVLLTAGLSPLKNLFLKWGWPNILSAAVCLVGGVVVVSGVLTVIISQVVSQSGRLADQTVAGVEQFSSWLSRSPVGVSQEQILRWQEQGVDWLTHWVGQSQALIAQYSLQAGSYIGNFIAGGVMALFAVFFLLHDGRNIWAFMLRFVPRAGRARTDRAGMAGWRALCEYVKATVMVAAVDAVVPLIAALIMGVPLAGALGALIFLGAFIPIVGVVLTGAVAVFVTLVTLGPIHALVMLGVIVLVNQLEGNILQPMLLGRAVSLHPLAVLFSIAVGISIAGIVGGLMVVPILAFTKSFGESLAGNRDAADEPVEPVAG